VKALEETGLKAASVCCNTHWNKPVSDPNAAVREEELNGLKQALLDPSVTARLRFVCGGGGDKDVTYADAYKRSQEEFASDSVGRGAGVKIAILKTCGTIFLLSPLERRVT